MKGAFQRNLVKLGVKNPLRFQQVDRTQTQLWFCGKCRACKSDKGLCDKRPKVTSTHLKGADRPSDFDGAMDLMPRGQFEMPEPFLGFTKIMFPSEQGNSEEKADSKQADSTGSWSFKENGQFALASSDGSNWIYTASKKMPMVSPTKMGKRELKHLDRMKHGSATRMVSHITEDFHAILDHITKTFGEEVCDQLIRDLKGVSIGFEHMRFPHVTEVTATDVMDMLVVWGASKDGVQTDEIGRAHV